MTVEEIKPTVDVPLDEAIMDLTGFEILGIQQRYGKFEDLGAAKTLLGAVWAYENRNVKTDWKTVEGMTFGALSGYFAQADPNQVDSEQSKK